MESRYLDGVIKDGSTPLGLSFEADSPVDVRLSAGLAWNAVWNDRGLRFCTQQQVQDHIRDLRPDPTGPAVEDEELSALIDRLLLSPTGLLEVPFPVEPVLVPRFPTAWQGVPVVVAENSPFVRPELHDPHWWADWWITPEQELRFYVQTDVARAIQYEEPEARRADLLDTFTHEGQESRLALRYAKGRYPRASFQQLGGLAQQFGGVAHVHTSDVRAEPSEADYNRKFYRDVRRLGLTT